MNSTRVQPNGVVLPELRERETGEYGDAFARGWKAYEREYKRLNSSTVSAGVVDERAAFEAAYLQANYPRVHSGELSAPPIFDRVGDMQFHGQVNGDYERTDVQSCWIIWQARAALSASAPNHSEQVREVLEWAVESWHAEVSQRPLVNVHRRSLDGTWRQIIRKLGGDPVDLCGPDHSTLLAAAPSAGSQGGDV